MSGVTPPPLSAPIRWLFIDVGGVLFDDDPLLNALYDYVSKALRARGIDAPQEEVQRVRKELIASRSSGIYKAVLRHFSSGKEMFRDILAEFRAWLEPQQAELNPMIPGVPEALADLSTEYNLALAANQGAYIHSLLGERGIRNYFSSATISGEVGLAKPDENFFRRMLADAGCRAEEAVMVGDSLTNDLIPAHNMGLRTVRVEAGGDNVRDPNAYHFVDGTVASLLELKTLLTTWKQLN